MFSSTELPPVEAAAKPGFIRANSGALATSAGISLLNGVAEGVIQVGKSVALRQVTNPNTDPDIALKQLAYLRNRFEDEHVGLWYAFSNSLHYQAAQEEKNTGLAWFDKVQQYWKARQSDTQVVEALIQVNMPGNYPLATPPGYQYSAAELASMSATMRASLNASRPAPAAKK